MSVIASTHTVVNSGRRGSRPFGAGILPSRPFAGRQPYTAADADAAVLMFAGSAEPDWDAMALESEYQDRLDAMAPATYGRCLNCSVVTDALEPNGLCPRCDVDACETSSVNRY